MYYNIDTKDRVYEFTEDEFEKIIAPKPRGEDKEIQLEFSLIEEKAKKIIKTMSDFTFDKFKTHIGITGSDMKNAYNYLDIKTKAYDKNGYGDKTAKPMKKALQEFFKREKVLELKEITPTKLRELEQYMRDKGISPTTDHRYIDSLKSVIVMAQRENIISNDIFPFGREKDKYFAPRVVTVKRAFIAP